MLWKLYLDDVRDCPHVGWAAARSVEEAWGLIQKHGVPQMISFDHDLGDSMPTGFDFAKGLVDKDLDANGLFLPTDFSWHVHSANGPGGDNIAGLMSGYLNFRSKLSSSFKI